MNGMVGHVPPRYTLGTAERSGLLTKKYSKVCCGWWVFILPDIPAKGDPGRIVDSGVCHAMPSDPPHEETTSILWKVWEARKNIEKEILD